MIIIILIIIIITIIIINNNDSNNSLRIIITVLLYSKIIRTRRIRVEFNVLQWIYWVELQKMKILVRLSMNTLKGGHITLIKFVCLSSPKIIYTACLINGGNFSIFHTQMPVILKVSVKWCLFDGILFNKTPMGRLVAVKSRLKSFSATCVSFSGCFAWKKKHTFTLLHLIQYFVWVRKDLNVPEVTSCFHISHLVTAHDLQRSFQEVLKVTWLKLPSSIFFRWGFFLLPICYWNLVLSVAPQVHNIVYCRLSIKALPEKFH